MLGWLCVVLLAATANAALPPTIVATTRITPELRASLTADYTLEVLVIPHDGDAWSRLAKRVTGDGANWLLIAKYNDANDKLTSDKRVSVPFGLLRPELRRQIIRSLFPYDLLTDRGWKHVVAGGSGIEGESLWAIAEWFTGAGANYVAIRRANPHQGLSTRKADVVLIPKELLAAAFGGEAEGRNASKKTAEVRKSEDDPIEHPGSDANVADLAVETVAAGQPSLSYERNAPEPYAIYRLQKGEALYSSVAIRFTGRVYSEDVGDVVDRIVQFNSIDDVSKIRVGHPVKIPMSLLLAEYLPPDDPSRLAQETAKLQSAKLARRARASGLAGVRIILDAGHGGRDVGTAHDGVWESNYVYDVMCRLKRILEKRSSASVSTTTKSTHVGYRVPETDYVEPRTDYEVLTSPKYDLEDPTVGVNLRWYLANSIYRRAVRRKVPKEKVVFLSIHADSLHPALRGAMAYIPAERLVTGSYRRSEDVYLARAEVREHPIVRHSEEESLAAEGLSRDLAESIVDTFQEKGLKVHPFHPVRDSVVRDGREWVPAIIRYNLVPARLLLEICNLGNSDDRKMMTTRAWRQKVAEAIYEGLVSFYADRGGNRSSGLTTAAK